MKKQLSKIALGMALMSSLGGFSQAGKIQPCNTYENMESYFATNPEAKRNFEASQKKLHAEYLENEKNLANTRSIAQVQYTIPIVFHILHTGGGENITDAQCIAAVAQMNSDYLKMGSDTSSIFAPFKSLYVNSDIRFMLAHKDPSGNCTTGIEHQYNTKTDWSQTSASSASYYTGITWDPTKYLNVIIVKQIIPTGTVTGGGIIVGYTRLPGSLPTGSAADAIVYNYGFLGGLNARSLSHEAGHWFGLSHTFGNTNNPGVVCGSTSGGDGVSDTPDTKGNFSTCPASSTNTAYTCTSPNPGNANDYYQNVQNIMDYSSCPKNFTQGQTTLMRTTLASTTAGRNNLSSTANLAATDVNATIPCAPIASYLAYSGQNISYTVCSGGSLTFKDYSYNGTPTSYSWSATNGAVIANPTASTTAISFPTTGTSIVSYQVSNAQGGSTTTNTITVLNGAAIITGNYYESFETPSTTPANWSVVNPNGIPWQQTSLSALDGSGSFYIDGSQSAAGQVDYLVMPIMDVVNNPNNIFKFSYAYARQSSTYNDKFELQGSLDCGGTWKDVLSLSAASMASNSGGTTTTPFVPTPSQWFEVDVTSYPYWIDYVNSASATFRFVFTESTAGGNGNNFYIDAVSFQGPSGLNELTKNYSLSLFPNPSNGEATLKFNLSNTASVNVDVVDVLGKTVLPSTSTSFSAGEQKISLNKNNTLSKGIYFVNLTINGAKMSKKLVIN